MRPPVVVWEGVVQPSGYKFRVVLMEPGIGEKDMEGAARLPDLSVEMEARDALGFEAWLPASEGWIYKACVAQALCSLWRKIKDDA